MSVFQVSFPPMDNKIVDEKGNLTEEWSNHLRSLYNLVLNNFNQQGVQLTTLTGDEVGNDNDGTTFYQSDEATVGQPLKTFQNADKHTIMVSNDNSVGARLPSVSAVTTINNPVKGQVVFNEASNSLRVFNGTVWV